MIAPHALWLVGQRRSRCTSPVLTEKRNPLASNASALRWRRLACGYTRVILWANSTAGLTSTRYLASRLAEDERNYCGVVAVVMTSPFWSFSKGKFGPLGLDPGPFGLSATCLAGQCLPLVPRLILAYDSEEVPSFWRGKGSHFLFSLAHHGR